MIDAYLSADHFENNNISHDGQSTFPQTLEIHISNYGIKTNISFFDEFGKYPEIDSNY